MLGAVREDSHTHDCLEKLMVLIQDYGTETWVGLYKIFEHVSAAVGGKSKLKSLGVPTQETQRFTHTANHPEASGLLSRHAVTREQAPKDPMTLADAQQYIQHLVMVYRQHIRSKAAV